MCAHRKQINSRFTRSARKPLKTFPTNVADLDFPWPAMYTCTHTGSTLIPGSQDLRANPLRRSQPMLLTWACPGLLCTHVHTHKKQINSRFPRSACKPLRRSQPMLLTWTFLGLLCNAWLDPGSKLIPGSQDLRANPLIRSQVMLLTWTFLGLLCDAWLDPRSKLIPGSQGLRASP